MPRFSADQEVTLRILPAVAFTFVAYFCIGAPLAILPSYLHLQLGISTLLAGFLVSLQYIATFASRPRAGHLSDTIGPRRTVRYGLLACTASGALMVLAAWLRHTLWLSLGTLALSRLALGTGESLSSTGSTMWGIGRVGGKHTARVISWNGVATYTAIAVGAPLGVLAAAAWGFGAVGAIIFVLCSISYLVATRMEATAPFQGKRVPIGHILLGVTPFGLALALGGTGFGVIATFITLYFAHQNWQGAALSLSMFGLCFVGVRLLFARTINRYGGFAVAIVSFCVEVAGLALLGLGRSQGLAYLGCGMAGMGFSLIFPALGVEAANAFPASVRGSVIGVYSAFADLSLFLAGPLAGAVIHGFGYSAVFLATAGAVLVALAGTLWLSSTSG
ncbi:MAG: MFS transporter [Holophaga sp.]|nr:MFS transporter [Holophaga sp.]